MIDVGPPRLPQVISIEVTATDLAFTLDEQEVLAKRPIKRWRDMDPHHFDTLKLRRRLPLFWYDRDAEAAVTDFCRLVADTEDWARRSENALMELLFSDEVAIPEFGSPVRGWQTFQSALHQTANLGLSYAAYEATGHNLWVFAGTYMGRMFMVRFIDPVITEASLAVAEGVGLKIRQRFGVAPRDESDQS
jgi:hypothetical protein